MVVQVPAIVDRYAKVIIIEIFALIEDSLDLNQPLLLLQILRSLNRALPSAPIRIPSQNGIQGPQLKLSLLLSRPSAQQLAIAIKHVLVVESSGDLLGGQHQQSDEQDCR